MLDLGGLVRQVNLSFVGLGETGIGGGSQDRQHRNTCEIFNSLVQPQAAPDVGHGFYVVFQIRQGVAGIEIVGIMQISHDVPDAVLGQFFFRRYIVVRYVYLADQQQSIRVDLIFGANLTDCALSESEADAKTSHDAKKSGVDVRKFSHFHRGGK